MKIKLINKQTVLIIMLKYKNYKILYRIKYNII